MNTLVLKTFISNLSFMSEKIKHPYSTDYEINILNQQADKEQITGTINLKYKSGENEVILFEIKMVETPDILIFKTKYQNEGRIENVIDTYAISADPKSFFGPKTKLLLHIVDSKVTEAYCVGKKYRFENGINDNLSKLNLNNKEVINILNQAYPSMTTRKR